MHQYWLHVRLANKASTDVCDFTPLVEPSFASNLDTEFTPKPIVWLRPAGVPSPNGPGGSARHTANRIPVVHLAAVHPIGPDYAYGILAVTNQLHANPHFIVCVRVGLNRRIDQIWVEVFKFCVFGQFDVSNNFENLYGLKKFILT
jgi:hypothetical protein